jgi:uncharacterized protein YqeY
MQVDAGSEMKARLRADLRTAMKDWNQLEARVIRSLVAAIDNAEAPEVLAEQAESLQHQFKNRSAEVDRLWLTRLQVREVLINERQERDRAAATFDRLDKSDRAAALREETRVIERYLT